MEECGTNQLPSVSVSQSFHVHAQTDSDACMHACEIEAKAFRIVKCDVNILFLFLF